MSGDEVFIAKSDLHVWHDGQSWVIARNVTEAIDAVNKNVGEESTGDLDNWKQLPDTEILKIYCEDDTPPQTRELTCCEWISEFAYSPAVIGSVDW